MFVTPLVAFLSTGLWDSATDTLHSLPARLAVVHLIHEARGLDVSMAARARLVAGGDVESLEILESNVAEEETHVGTALRWFVHVFNNCHTHRGCAEPCEPSESTAGSLLPV